MKRRWPRILVYGIIAFMAISAAALAIGRKAAGRSLQLHINAAADRAMANRSTVADRLFLMSMYFSMDLYGRFAYPEAAQILREYLHGTSDSLQISSAYLRQARLIRRSIGKTRNGNIGPVYLRLSDDRRIAYAINGFYLRVQTVGRRTNVRVYQDIVFSRLSEGCNVYTSFHFPGVVIRVPDCLVHVVRKRRSDSLYVYADWYE